MRRTSVLCWICHELVEVVDKVIAEHGSPLCETSGARYLPSPRTLNAGPGGPKVEVLATKHLEPEACANCGETHSGTYALLRVSAPNPGNN